LDDRPDARAADRRVLPRRQHPRPALLAPDPRSARRVLDRDARRAAVHALARGSAGRQARAHAPAVRRAGRGPARATVDQLRGRAGRVTRLGVVPEPERRLPQAGVVEDLGADLGVAGLRAAGALVPGGRAQAVGAGQAPVRVLRRHELLDLHLSLHDRRAGDRRSARPRADAGADAALPRVVARHPADARRDPQHLAAGVSGRDRAVAAVLQRRRAAVHAPADPLRARARAGMSRTLSTAASRTRTVLGFASARSDTLAALGPKVRPTAWYLAVVGLIALLAVVARASAISVGLMSDDFMQHAMLHGLYPGDGYAPFDLYGFLRRGETMVAHV